MKISDDSHLTEQGGKQIKHLRSCEAELGIRYLTNSCIDGKELFHKVLEHYGYSISKVEEWPHDSKIHVAWHTNKEGQIKVWRSYFYKDGDIQKSRSEMYSIWAPELIEYEEKIKSYETRS